jgi:hypothetical protein
MEKTTIRHIKLVDANDGQNKTEINDMTRLLILENQRLVEAVTTLELRISALE